MQATTVDPAGDRFVDLVGPHWPAMVALAVRLCGRADGEDVAAAEEPGADLDLRAAITQLSERQELAVALFYYLDLPIDEVAAAMGCSAGTVKSTLFDARHRLRDLLEPQEDV